MGERKKLHTILYDKSTGWWFSKVRDASKNCGRAKHLWAKDKDEASCLYRRNIERIVSEHAAMKPNTLQIDDARSWSSVDMAAHYYDLKKSDGCGPLFLAAIKCYLQRFLDWLKQQSFDAYRNSAEDLTSALLAGYRQTLADDRTIGIKTANHYIDHVRMLLLWGLRMHGIRHPPIDSIRQFSTRKNAKNGHGRKHDRTPLSWKQLEMLFSAADVTDAAILMLGLNCGFGNMDVGTLRLCDVDLENDYCTSSP